MRFVAIKDIGDQPGAACQVEEFIGKTNQAARRNAVFQTHTAATIRLHVEQFALALAQSLHHAALVLLFDIGGDHFNRLVAHTIDVLEDHARLAHSQLKTFAAHVFQQNGQVQFTATHHLKDAFFCGFPHAQGHIVLQFLLQAVPDLTARDVLAFTPGQRTGIDTKVHGQGGLIDLEHWQRCRVDRVSDGHTNADVGQAVDQHNFARSGIGGLHALKPLKGQDLVDATLDRLAIGSFHDHHVHHRLDRALADASNTNAPDEGGKVECRNLQLQRCCRVALLVRHMLKDGVEQSRHVGPPLFTLAAFYQR
ncbi:hypothetical protein GALL_475620 [mine drainage metagenome]|uniref:Uncharacterized protein n=1 Tax=mine drainage metagenome TaxID=410659 RepID=A0A1J5PJ48_9ZZZZ